MIKLLLEAREAELKELVRELDARPRGDRSVVVKMEAAIAADPGATLSFDASGGATVAAAGHRFSGGTFAPRSIADLRLAAGRRGAPGAKSRFSVLCGRDPITDIGMLQANAEPATLFQVASQFNCLEAPGPGVVRVQDYFGDSTQGPRASISAFPGTLVRHYGALADDGARFVQTDTRQLNLLSAVLPEQFARVKGGYLMTQEILNLDRAADQLETDFELLRVGVHAEVPVVLGHRWDGPAKPGQTIGQVFTSTLALGGYSEGPGTSPAAQRLCRQLLRGAYLGTLLAGVALRQRRVVLTMIGGGVFDNPHELIFECIQWALAQVDQIGAIDVVLNGRELKQSLGEQVLLDAARARGGVVVEAQDGAVRLLS